MKSIVVTNLRDTIAISAMNAIISTDTTYSQSLESVAAEAYQYADAMLKARSQAHTEQDVGVSHD